MPDPSSPSEPSALSDPRHTLLFLRAPRFGTVKSRLALSIGPHAALDAYRQLLATLTHNLRDWPSLEARVTPDDASPEVRPFLQPRWSTAPQGSGDLGQRLHRATLEHFDSQNARSLVIIGSDCPEVSQEDLSSAHELLQRHEVVLGPALDGGYWLIGLSRPVAELFDAMPWGTEHVYAETVRRARALGLSLANLRPLADIDTVEDWTCWLNRPTP